MRRTHQAAGSSVGSGGRHCWEALFFDVSKVDREEERALYVGSTRLQQQEASFAHSWVEEERT